MKRRYWLATISLSIVACVILGLWLTAPRYSVAFIQVVDAAGKPVAGASVFVEGMRTKPGNFQSGWYGWNHARSSVPHETVVTGPDGWAKLPYPKFVFEYIETGTLCLSVNHPDYVPARPERVVASAPPAGAPWRIRLEDIWDRLRHKKLVARPEPVELQKGAAILLTANQPASAKDAPLFGQFSAGLANTNQPYPGKVLATRLAAGRISYRAVCLETNGTIWFSEVQAVPAAAGQTQECQVELLRGLRVRGQLDVTVPRPVNNGRVVAQVWPKGFKPESDPPTWHTWAPVETNGSFYLGCLPAGLLEITAYCDGYVSTNGRPRETSLIYPQQCELGSNDASLTIGMEPTAQLEVLATDEQDKPLKDAIVALGPNIRYGDWYCTIFMSDCFQTADKLRPPSNSQPGSEPYEPKFYALTGTNGLAIISNLPPLILEITAEHQQYDLPVVDRGGGMKYRLANCALAPGQTNRLTLKMERKGKSPMTHY